MIPKPFDSSAAIAQEYKDYAYIVSHDLSAPARAIVEFSQLLQNEESGSLTEDAKLYLTMVMENGKKLQSMLAALLAYSRVDTSAKLPTSVDTQQIIEECCAALPQQGIKIDCQNLPILQADVDQVRQLFTALIGNSIKFIAPGQSPHIKILSRPEEQTWHFIVEDNGIGINPKFHERIFQVFQRLHTDNEYPGVGMGLALAKKIVTRHGGKIWVEPSELGGTAFHFILSNKNMGLC